jgi:hypothetical protein
MTPERALSKLTAEAKRLSDELADLRNVAAGLPRAIRIQLNNAIEEADLLRHRLHEATLARVIHKPPPGEERAP